MRHVIVVVLVLRVVVGVLVQCVVVVVLVQRLDCRCHSTTFICVKAIQTSKVYSINNNKSN